MGITVEKYQPDVTDEHLICNTCGTLFPTEDRTKVTTCHICDDPRQYIPPSGQSFTTMEQLKPKHKNEFIPYESDPRFIFIKTTPSFAISQRAILVKTPTGNVLWDCVTLLDDETIQTINEMGGLKAIVISHPHYYTTHVEWARAFGCPVFLASEDLEWTTLRSPHQVAVTEIETSVLDTGVQIIKLGGHFPGSLVLLFDKRLLIADTLTTSPSALGKVNVDALGNPRSKPPGLNSFSFLWSIPNRIPLSADEIARMWGILRAYDFESTHGPFDGQDVEDIEIKQRVLDSMKIQIRFMGWTEHALLKE